MPGRRPAGETRPTRRSVAPLWQRIDSASVSIGAVDQALQAWDRTGGCVSLVGPSGAGRSFQLRRAAAALRGAGRTVVEILPGPHSGAPLARLLRSGALPGPEAAMPSHRSPERRARAAAAAVHARASPPLWILVDDVDQLDKLTARALTMLLDLGDHRVLSAGLKPAPWPSVSTDLPPFDSHDVQTFLGKALGTTAPPAELVQLAVSMLGGNPGRTAATLVRCASEGTLTPGPSGWRLKGSLKANAPTQWSDQTRLTGLTRENIHLGGILAHAHSGLRTEALLELLRLDAPAKVMELAEPLIHRGLARTLDGRLCCSGLTARTLLAPRLEGIPANLRTHLLRAERAHLLLAGPLPSATHTHVDLEALARADPAEAGRIGRRLLADNADEQLASSTANALLAAGEPLECIHLLEQLTGGRSAPLRDSALLLSRLALRRLLDQADHPAARTALRRARHALPMGLPVPLTVLTAEATLAVQEGSAEQALSIIRVALGPDGPLPEPGEHTLLSELCLMEAVALGALGRLDEALDKLRDPPDSLPEEDRERCLLTAAGMLRKARRQLEASERFARTANIDPVGVSRQHVHWLEQAAVCAQQGGDPSAAVVHWLAAASLAGQVSDASQELPLLVSCARVLGELRRNDEAESTAEIACQRAQETGRPNLAAAAAMILADLCMDQAELERAGVCLDRAEDLLDATPLHRHHARLARRRAELAVAQDADDAEEVVQHALALAKRTELNRDRCRVLALQAICDARAGREARIAPTLESAMEPLREQGSSAALAEVRLSAARAWLAVDKPELAQAAAARSLVWAEESGRVALRLQAEALCDRARAMLERGPSGAIDRTIDRLLDVSIALASERDLDILLARINGAALELLAGDRAFVLLLDDRGVAHVRSAAGALGQDPGKPSRSIVRSALDRGGEIVVSDIDERLEYRANQSLVGSQVRSAMCMPMVDRDRAVGLLYVDSRHVGRRELSDATRALRALAGHAAVAVANARLIAESEARARRASEVAHDLRSPAASILMAAREVANEPGLPTWVTETADLVGEQADKLIRMAERYLTGRQSSLSVFDIADRTQRLIRLQAPAARARDRSVLFHARSHPLVRADPEDLDRALNNLMSNAVRHTPSGTAVEIHVEQLHDKVRWSIRDQGAGIDDAVLPTLFESGVKGDGGEHGLGLSISLRIIQQFGGTIAAHNRAQGGAEFVVTLPAAESVSGTG